MIEPASFLFSLRDETGVATITLNRPDRLNALTFDVYQELGRAFYTLHDEEYVRVDGEWKFHRILLEPVFWTPFDKGWAEVRSILER